MILVLLLIKCILLNIASYMLACYIIDIYKNPANCNGARSAEPSTKRVNLHHLHGVVQTELGNVSNYVLSRLTAILLLVGGWVWLKWPLTWDEKNVQLHKKFTKCRVMIYIFRDINWIQINHLTIICVYDVSRYIIIFFSGVLTWVK